MTKIMDWEYVTRRLKKANLSCSSVDLSISKMKEIDALRNEKNALILAHYYQILPVQLLADFTGDSLALAEKSSKITDQKLIFASRNSFLHKASGILI